MKKVTKKDLKGDIADFPLEVVQWMCDQQVKQENEFDPKVFQIHRSASGAMGGFEWNKTNESHPFCVEVIANENFDLFFERYPKQQPDKTNPEPTHTYLIVFEFNLENNRRISNVVFNNLREITTYEQIQALQERIREEFNLPMYVPVIITNLKRLK